jgi:hypothetical protein
MKKYSVKLSIDKKPVCTMSLVDVVDGETMSELTVDYKDPDSLYNALFEQTMTRATCRRGSGFYLPEQGNSWGYCTPYDLIYLVMNYFAEPWQSEVPPIAQPPEQPPWILLV